MSAPDPEGWTPPKARPEPNSWDVFCRRVLARCAERDFRRDLVVTFEAGTDVRRMFEPRGFALPVERWQ